MALKIVLINNERQQMAEYVFIFPGQGSQFSGMGKDLCEEIPAAKEVFNKANDALDINISEICFNGSDQDLTITNNAQPAVTAVNLAVLAALKDKGIKPVAVAGHSLGEYAANCASGVFDITTAIKLTRKRGELMQACADKRPGSMAAIIGLDMEEVRKTCEEIASSSGKMISVANFNSPAQVVITGESEPVKEACAAFDEKGAKRVVELKVSGPWHSKLMQNAQDEFESVLKETNFSDPEIPVYANIDATPKTNGDDSREALVKQVTGSVQWTQTIQKIRSDFPDAIFVECGPGKVLKGLLRQIDRGAKCFGVENINTLTSFLEKT
jgi:[acyl-carrier-protein] S-malonyltransferase